MSDQWQARLVDPKSNAQLAAEWDRAASARAAELESGLDLSFDSLITPAMLSLLPNRISRLLDVGCGTGTFTVRLASLASDVVGIDPSGVGVALARARSATGNVRYIVQSVESYAQTVHSTFDVATANMVLMDIADLDEAVRAIASVLIHQGLFIFSILHPWFWPDYWGYARESWFRYHEEQFIEAPFRISMHETGVVTTHVHRPLSRYFASLADAGFRLDRLLEPLPGPELERRYPGRWQYPRFLVARAMLVRGSVPFGGRPHS